MTGRAKLLERVLKGSSDANIEFGPLCELLKHLGFQKCIRGDHHIFSKNGVAEILNLQPLGHHAKSYQVKQVRTVIIHYKLGGEIDAK